MPTKRRFFIFLIVLALMLLIKYASGQEAAGDSLGWDPASCWDCDSGLLLEAAINGTILSGVIFGCMAGAFRILSRNRAARYGRYFTGDLISLHLN